MVKIDIDKKNGFALRKILFQHKFIWIFAILVALAAGFFAWQRGEKFTASLALTVSRQGTQQAVDYKYDNYYALQATDEFGDTVAGWLKTPEVASAINAKAGINSAGWSLSALSGKFRAAKISANLVEVRYGAASDAEARRLAQAVGQVISEKTNLINISSAQGIAFSVISGEPVIVKNTYDIWFNVLAGFLAGLVFGFFISVAKEYFRS